MLELGDFTDFDRLFDVLALAAEQAESWEEQLLPFDEEDYEDEEPETYDPAEGEPEDELEDDEPEDEE